MRTLLAKVMAIVVAFLLLHSLLTYSVSTFLYGSAVSENILSEVHQKLSQFGANVDAVVNNVIASGNLICRDIDLLQFLNESSSMSFPEIINGQNPRFPEWYLSAARPLLNRISAVKNSMLYQYNASIYLIDINGVYFTDQTIGYVDISSSTLVQEVLDKNGYILQYAPASSLPMFSGMSDGSLAVGYAIHKNYSSKLIGALLIAIELPEPLSAIFEETGNGRTLMLDAAGQVVIGGDAQTRALDWNALGLTDSDAVSLTLDGSVCYAISASIPRTPWRIVQLIPHETLFAQLNMLRRMSLSIILVLSVTEFVLLLIIIQHAMQPLRNLNRLINKVGEGNFQLSAPVKGRDEVAQISESFNTMVRRIDQLMKHSAIQHKLQEQAMLQTLRAQINPHFLLNTLNDIKWQAIIDGNANVGSMLSTLGALLETSLGRNSTFVTLAEELCYTEKYVRLANLRFGDRLKTVLDISPEASGLYIPVLILQPLLENITMHGLREEGDTQVDIHAWTEADSLFIVVHDDGNGISPETLRDIRAAMADFQNIPRKSIGINNVHKRIVLTYGPEYGLTIDSTPDQGTSVRMRFPVQREREADLI